VNNNVISIFRNRNSSVSEKDPNDNKERLLQEVNLGDHSDARKKMRKRHNKQTLIVNRLNKGGVG